MRLLLMSTPVGSLGSGLGGGVELTIANLAKEMTRRGHVVKIIAPAPSSMLDLDIVDISGNLQVPAQTQGNDVPIVLPNDPVLGNMWDYARRVYDDWDIIFNIAFDWLPFYLTPFFQRPIAHFISMAATTSAIEEAMERVARDYPQTIGVCSQTQADTFKFAEYCRVLGGSGLDVASYNFYPEADNYLGWMGRISPEKGLEDAVLAARSTGCKLKVLGKVQDEGYWQEIEKKFGDGTIEYCGFVETKELSNIIGKCRALLVTPRWVEAFGNVAIEALICGVPVIAYRRGGLTEIVTDGETGYLTEPDSVDGLIEAIAKIDSLDRLSCRQYAIQHHSLGAWGDRVENWLQDILKP